MMGKVFLLLRTIKYLKAKQIIYQVYYKLKPKRTLGFYKDNPVNFSFLNFSLHYSSPLHYKENSTFEFLNEEHTFQNNINWNFQKYGKLWNYNLQYFNFLHQQNVSNHQKECWLHDIAEWMYSGKLILEPYPVSLRVINTIRYLSSSQVRDKTIIETLYAQLNYLYHNPEYHLLGNHLLENAFALLMGAQVFDKKSWSIKAKKILTQELEEQILEDGGHFEQSVMYHQVITFRMLELIDWYRNIYDADAGFLELIETVTVKMLNWLKTMSFENDSIPHFNDSANDVTFTPNEIFTFAALLKLPAPKFISLKDSGYRRFSNNKYECIVDAGNITAMYQPGHSHADALSFVVNYNNEPVIVDTGTSTYEAGERRNLERSTAAHNTVAINNSSQSEAWGSFRIGRRASVKIINETSSLLEATHNGYKQFDAIHQRSFYFSETSIKILDIINGSKNSGAIFYLHFHPERIVEKHREVIKVDNAIISFAGVKNIKLESYKFALAFNKYSDAKVLIAEFEKSLETLINFV
jgi:uncharacterized heparinase superfamily protein